MRAVLTTHDGERVTCDGATELADFLESNAKAAKKAASALKKKHKAEHREASQPPG